MGRRLRIGRKVEKADPARRAGYYMQRTVGRVAARLAEQSARRETGGREQIVATVTAVADGSGGGPGAAEPEQTVEPGPGPAEFAEPGQAVEPEQPEPEPAELAEPGQAVEPEPAPQQRPLRVVEPEHDPVVEFADAPREPIAGLDGPQPAPPDDTEAVYTAQLGGLLGLPEGFSVWGAQQRKMADGRQMRLWLSRSGLAALARPEEWPAGRLRATDWRPKRDFDSRSGVGKVLRHDLDVFADPAREWVAQGIPVLYRLMRAVRDATPAEFVRLALLTLLGPRSADGTVWFSVARDTGDPYVVPGAGGAPDVWLPVRAVSRATAELGYSPGARAVLDVLADLGCKVSAGMVVVEEHRTVRDSAQWARLPVELGDEELWAEVVARAQTREVRDRERVGELRRVGSGDVS